MKVGLLLDLLNDFESLIESVGGSQARQDVRELHGLFSGYENSTVAQFLAKLMKGRDVPQGAVASRPIQRLEDTLSKLRILLAGAKAKGKADDIQKIVHLLHDSGHATITQFVQEARSWAAKPTNRRTGSTKLDPAELVSKYVDVLRGISNNNNAFDRAVAELNKNKAVRTQEMREIAKNYLGYELAKKKGRKDALAAIVDRQALDARQQARGEIHDRGKAW